mgnify:CR=1 FL=1
MPIIQSSAAVKLAFTLARSGFSDRLAARVASAAEGAQDDPGPTAGRKDGTHS